MRFSVYLFTALFGVLSLPVALSAQPNTTTSTVDTAAQVEGAEGAEPTKRAEPIERADQVKSTEHKLQTLWIFEGPLAPRIQGFAREMYAERVAAHIFDRATLVQHLKRALMTQAKELDQEALSCLADKSTCDDQALLMRRLSLKERIFVSAIEDEKGFEVTLERRGQDRGAVKRLKVRNTDLSEACSVLFEQLLQVGTLSISGLPSSFSLSVDGQALDVERWPVVLEAGEHDLTLSAPEHEPLKVKVPVKPSLLTELEVKLLSSKAKVKILVLGDEQMKDLIVKVDEQVIKPGEITELNINQDYEISAQAEDRSSYLETLRFGPGENVATVTITLPYSRPYWKIALKRPHEERLHNSLAYVRISGGQLNAGSWRGSASNADRDIPTTFKSQGYGASSWGVDLGLKWDSDPTSSTGSLRLDVVGFGYQYMSDALTINEAKPSGSGDGVTLTSLERYLTRLLWVGYQATMWRVTPYANLGLIWLYERGEIANNAGEVSAHALRLGWEFGFDALLTPEWGLKTSLMADAWPGQRSAYQLSIGVTYAFSVPELF